MLQLWINLRFEPRSFATVSRAGEGAREPSVAQDDIFHSYFYEMGVLNSRHATSRQFFEE
jgi:hypothetical protein